MLVLYVLMVGGMTAFLVRVARSSREGASRTPSIRTVVELVAASDGVDEMTLLDPAVIVAGRIEALEQTLQAPLTETECVWWRDRESIPGGEDRTVVHDRVETMPFLLVDDGAAIVVRAAGAEVGARHSDRPIVALRVPGHDHEEWTLVPGQRVAVCGGARFWDGEVRIVQTSQARLRITAQEPEELLRSLAVHPVPAGMVAAVWGVGFLILTLLFAPALVG